jgi:hypothetical protein
MYAYVKTFLDFYLADWKDLLLLGVIMVSAITVFVGILKPLLFNKIKWKPLRRASLAFTNVALCFACVAVGFLIKKYDFSVYLHTAVATSLFSIIWYWVYENTCLRDLISKIGGVALSKCYAMVKKLFDKNDAQEIEKEISILVEELKTNAKKEIKSATKNVKTDKELKNL